MNFGDILDKWEKRAPGNKVYAKDEGAGGETSAASERRRGLLRKRPDAVIDLHGLTSDEAWIALKAFFENSRHKAFEKVLVIHGKGEQWNFTPNKDIVITEGVLKDLAARFIKSCPYVAESGYCRSGEGGSGATWVIFKERIYRSR